MPELRALRTFVAVAEELSFTRAAERLHLGQQAVSKSVANLERELGVELLERTTREVRLTAAGAELLEAGRDALLAADTAFERAREAGRGLSGTVTVGVSPAIGSGERSEVVAVLRDGAPDLSVAVVEVRPRDVRAQLQAGTVDLVLVRAAGLTDGVDSAALRPTPTVLVVPEDHRLAGRGPLDVAELDGERLMVFSPPGTPYTDLLLTRLAAGGARVEPVEARVTGDRRFPELAAAGAVTLVAAPWDPVPGLVAVELATEVTLPLLVLWPAGRPTPVVRRVRDALSSAGRAA
ncbi:LysR family transcriptional regulator [Conexibacter sp. SYSU D00693]|uniref:LysR family transcriptional regulator n=1 Tax=Conexibacter sp. SYSU D00693 TaxID=2812560 RepID=UPI00196A9DDE|nr:LysR substrate-binding domain-containing protein [Conexibacter sp. SYSU D00693]